MDHAGALPQFPGATGLTALDVYDWETDDGLRGGSPHMHLTCTECYVVVSGHGTLQTLTINGVRDSLLSPGDVVWFTPGTIHRAINTDGALRVIVVMENGGLPEAGDAVLTLPPQYLADPETYRAAVSLVAPHELTPSPERARARRDLAVAGYTELRDKTLAGDAAALNDFYSAASTLVAPRLSEWRSRWEMGAHAAAELTGARLSALSRGDYSHLLDATTARVEQPAEQSLGMCGLLRAYDPVRLAAGTKTSEDAGI